MKAVNEPLIGMEERSIDLEAVTNTALHLASLALNICETGQTFYTSDQLLMLTNASKKN